jgi:hypothetical protein
MTSGSQAVELGELKQAMQRMTPQWVSTPEISKVLEFESGRSRDVKDVIGSDYARVMLMWTANKLSNRGGACNLRQPFFGEAWNKADRQFSSLSIPLPPKS